MHVVEKEKSCVDNLQFIFCTDDMLLEVNKKHLNHDTLTDTITFNYNSESRGIAGDIFISYERVWENAYTYKVTVLEELHRVIIHGVLHLLGYDDKEETDALIIRAKENYYLTLLS